MEQKKNIDRLFQEKFKDFEMTPDDAVWDNIEETLQKDKRKRRIIPIWWKLGGVAALIALLFTVGKLTIGDSNPENTTNTSIVDGEKDSTSTSKTNTTTTKSSTSPIADTNNDAIEVDESQANSTHQKSNEKTSVVTTNSENKNNSFSSPKRQSNQGIQDKNKPLINTSERGKIAENTAPNLPKSTSSQTEKNNNGPSIEETVKNNIKSATTIDDAVANTVQKENNSANKKPESSEDEVANAIEDAIAETTTEDEDEQGDQELKSSKWRVSPNVAPVYFNSLGEGSPIDEQFAQNSKSGDINMSYGINGSYAFNNKLKVRVGVNKVDLNQTTNNVILYSNANSNSARMQNVSGNSSAAVLSAQNLSDINSLEIVKTQANNSLDQQFGFIEVPVELEYALISKKFGVNLIGGFSSLFLSNNDVYAISDSGDRIRIGEATNIKDTSFSANLGLGLNYNLSKSLDINLEPMFKYQINTFTNTSGNFKPYFIGVYTGLSFKF